MTWLFKISKPDAPQCTTRENGSSAAKPARPAGGCEMDSSSPNCCDAATTKSTGGRAHPLHRADRKAVQLHAVFLQHSAIGKPTQKSAGDGHCRAARANIFKRSIRLVGRNVPRQRCFTRLARPGLSQHRKTRYQALHNEYSQSENNSEDVYSRNNNY